MQVEDDLAMAALIGAGGGFEHRSVSLQDKKFSRTKRRHLLPIRIETVARCQTQPSQQCTSSPDLQQLCCAELKI